MRLYAKSSSLWNGVEFTQIVVWNTQFYVFLFIGENDSFFSSPSVFKLFSLLFLVFFFLWVWISYTKFHNSKAKETII